MNTINIIEGNGIIDIEGILDESTYTISSLIITDITGNSIDMDINDIYVNEDGTYTARIFDTIDIGSNVSVTMTVVDENQNLVEEVILENYELFTSDVSADITTTANMEVGTPFQYEIIASGDEDWIRVSLEEGITYRIDNNTGTYILDTSVRVLGDGEVLGVYDRNGNEISISRESDEHNSFIILTPTQSGEYFIGVASSSGNTGVNAIEVNEIEPSPIVDISEDITTTATMDINSTFTSQIDSANDQDWVKISFVEGQTYQINLNGDSLRDTYLRGIYDENGILIQGTTNDDGGAGLNSLVTFTASYTGEYFISAGAYSNNTGTYSLEVTTNNTAPTIQTPLDNYTLTDTQIQTGNIIASDVDGDILNYSVSSNALHGNVSVDENGVWSYVANEHYLGNDTAQITVDDGHGGTVVKTLNFTMETTNTEISEDIYTTATMDVNSVFTSQIDESFDKDWVKISLIEGYDYKINLNGNSLSDTFLTGIYNENGVLLHGTSNDDSNGTRNSEVIFSANYTGDYFISAGAFSRNTGTYTLEVKDIWENRPQPAITVIDNDGIISASEQHDISVRICNVYGNSFIEYIEVMDERGETIYISNDQFRIVNDEIIVHHVDVSSLIDGELRFKAFGTTEYDHRIDVRAIVEKDAYSLVDTISQDLHTTAHMDVDSVFLNTINSGYDRDWIKISLEAGHVYQINLNGHSLGDPYLHGIYNADGRFIEGTSNDDNNLGLNSEVTFTATYSGEYFINAGAYGDHTGTYSLEVNDINHYIPELIIDPVPAVIEPELIIDPTTISEVGFELSDVSFNPEVFLTAELMIDPVNNYPSIDELVFNSEDELSYPDDIQAIMDESTVTENTNTTIEDTQSSTTVVEDTEVYYTYTSIDSLMLENLQNQITTDV